MRPILILPALLLLMAGCGDAPSVAAAGDLRARQEAACTAAIAAHIRQPETNVASRWQSEAGGVASVEAIDGNRRHLCTVDAAGRVLGYSHPGA